MPRFRDLSKMQTTNDDKRTLTESIMVPEIVKALRDWTTAGLDAVLIGGLALSFYVKPRMTQDIDVVVLSDAMIPDEVQGFKKTRSHCFVHRSTHVEVEVVTPEFVNVPAHVFEQVIATARESQGVRIASPSGIVALKLFRHSMQDRADIVALINYETIDLTGFNLPQDRLDKFVALLADADAEK